MKSKISVSLSSFLRSSREASGLSQLEVARHLGYKSAQFISNWERGLSSPPVETLYDLAEIFKINRNEFFNFYLEHSKAQLEKDIKAAFAKKRRKRQ